jgi:hypothetical protein
MDDAARPGRAAVVSWHDGGLRARIWRARPGAVADEIPQERLMHVNVNTQ